MISHYIPSMVGFIAPFSRFWLVKSVPNVWSVSSAKVCAESCPTAVEDGLWSHGARGDASGGYKCEDIIVKQHWFGGTMVC